MHSNYSRYTSSEVTKAYSEVYAGVISTAVSARLYYSPNYVARGTSTLYLEVEKAVQPAPKWRVSAHAGILAHVGGARAAYARHAHYDWRFGLSRELGPVTLQAAWTSGGPGRDNYEGRDRSRSALIFGATWIL